MNINPKIECAVCANAHPPENPTGKLQTCSGCRAVVYCSRECQKNDWPTHKILCLKSSQTKIECYVGDNSIGSTTGHRVPTELANGRTTAKAAKKLEKLSSRSPQAAPRAEPQRLQGREQRLIRQLHEDKIKEVIVALQHEPDLDLSIRWIKGQLTTIIHPMLCLELYRIMLLQLAQSSINQTTKPLFMEALAHKMLGMNLTVGDVDCMNDKSATATVGALQWSYNPGPAASTKIHELVALNPKLEQQVRAIVKDKLEYIRDHLDLLGTPHWVREHKMSVFMGIDPTKPKAEWNAIRLANIEKALVSLV